MFGKIYVGEKTGEKNIGMKKKTTKNATFLLTT